MVSDRAPSFWILRVPMEGSCAARIFDVKELEAYFSAIAPMEAANASSSNPEKVHLVILGTLDVIAVGCADGKIHVHNICYDEVVSFSQSTRGAVTALSFRTGKIIKLSDLVCDWRRRKKLGLLDNKQSQDGGWLTNAVVGYLERGERTTQVYISQQLFIALKRDKDGLLLYIATREWQQRMNDINSGVKEVYWFTPASSLVR
ncbi:U3 small nucleolar RNA-associated protein 21 [Tanacetum coccineum]